MATITATNALGTELAAKYKLFIITGTLAATSDTITLTAAAHSGITTILGVFPVLETGLAANYASLQVSFSGLVITVVSKNAAGAAATSWGDVRLLVVGY